MMTDEQKALQDAMKEHGRALLDWEKVLIEHRAAEEALVWLRHEILLWEAKEVMEATRALTEAELRATLNKHRVYRQLIKEEAAAQVQLVRLQERLATAAKPWIQYGIYAKALIDHLTGAD